MCKCVNVRIAFNFKKIMDMCDGNPLLWGGWEGLITINK